jgi:hypothetical protein
VRLPASGSFSGVITGAFLAEAASVADNKLNVSGGVLYGFVVGPDRKAEFVLVVITQETEDPDRQITVEFRPPTGDEPFYEELELPDEAVEGEVGFAYFPLEVELPFDGRWVLLVTGGLGVISVPLLVSEG